MPTLEEVLDGVIVILKILLEKPLNQTEIAMKTGMNKNRIGRMIEALAQRGLVEKTVDPGPPRQTIIKLTLQGECLAKCLTT